MSSFIFDIPADHTPLKAKDIRDQFNVLAVNHITSDPNFPRNPRDGMLRVFSPDGVTVALQLFFGTWRNLYINVGTQARKQEQIFTSLAQWVFDHNLGTYPIVQVYDSSGREIIPEHVDHISTNRVIVTHSAITSGKIIVVG